MDQLSGESIKSTDDSQFDRKDWIEFYDEYLETQQTLNEAWYEEHPPARGWALGRIYDSFTFPQSLAGRVVRTPGRYRVTNPLTGIQKKGVLMRDTQEFIHASVRARIDLGGTDAEPKPSSWSRVIQWLRRLIGREGKRLYKPEALRGWELHDGHKQHNGCSINAQLTTGGDGGVMRVPWWEWRGKDKQVPQGHIMNEDVLGKFELQLVGSGRLAQDIEASNKGLGSVEELNRARERETRRSVTV